MTTISHTPDASQEATVTLPPWAELALPWATDSHGFITGVPGDDYVEFFHKIPTPGLSDVTIRVCEFVTPDPADHQRTIYVDFNDTAWLTTGQARVLSAALAEAEALLAAVGGSITPEVK